MNRHGHFDAFARALHWSMAILILAMLFVGVGMVASLSLRPVLIDLHRPLGMALLALALIRLLHRWRSPPPPLPASLPRAQAFAAKASHVALYAAMLAMPLLGWAMLSAGGYPVRMTSTFSLPPLLPQDPALYSLLRLAHGWVGYALFALILLHAAAALHHAWVRRDGVFEAMARGRSGTTTTAAPDPGTPPES
ncbi:cytochrome b/b6 domain-containing protein [Pseudoxanthomonas sp. LH2527]|uniref:cytochrome b n=1 Tax=Pseudoxanthomonas sp. LH2527 TaxID=2923249 RepID=UPI001F129BA4|nr:cytochrome b/b6 domain-containing protein [Pseudoxanthomonas sp. LH2527]MCH6485209.1 cytochrome b/b6 domain-containing protein [Pseudoxanthomonas sp. LH2527]